MPDVLEQVLARVTVLAVRDRLAELGSRAEGAATAGYLLHRDDPVLARVARWPGLVERVGDLLGPDVDCVGATVVATDAHAGAAFAWVPVEDVPAGDGHPALAPGDVLLSEQPVAARGGVCFRYEPVDGPDADGDRVPALRGGALPSAG